MEIEEKAFGGDVIRLFLLGKKEKRRRGKGKKGETGLGDVDDERLIFFENERKES